MKHLLLVGVVLGLGVMGGCGGGALAVPAKTFLDSVGNEYTTYVTADPKLDADQKARRIQFVSSFQRAVDEANK